MHDRQQKRLDTLPGPKGLPILGSMFDLDPKKLHSVLQGWCDTYGTMYTFKVAHMRFVVCSDPRTVQHVLSARPEEFRRLSTLTAVVDELGGTGMFSAEGEAWKRQRRIAMPAFHNRNLKAFFPVLEKVTARLKNSLAMKAGGDDVDIPAFLNQYTVDVTTFLAFGFDMNTIEGQGGALQGALAQIFPAIGRRMNAPFPYWRYFKLPADRRLDRAMEVVQGKAKEMIAHAKMRIAENPGLAENPTNFLEALLTAKDENGSSFTPEEIFGNVLTIMVAGEDSTASTMSWLMYYLIEHPELQEKIHKEAIDAFGDAPMATRTEQLDGLTWTEAAALETLRLSRVSPFVPLEAAVDTELEGTSIPKGVVTFVLFTDAQLSDKYFTRAKEFLPQRWIASERPSEWTHNPSFSMPFGGGPRFCPGRSLAFLEIKMLISMFAKNFRLLPPNTKRIVKDEFTFVTQPVGLFGRIERR